MLYILIILCVIVLFFTKAGKGLLGAFISFLAFLLLASLWLNSKSCGDAKKEQVATTESVKDKLLAQNAALPQTENTANVQNTTTETTTLKPKAFEEIEKQLSDCVVIIHSFSNPFKGHQAGNGNKYIVANIEIRNTGKDEIGYSGEFQWKLTDADGYSYDAVSLDVPHELGTGSINPGQRARGLVIFNVPVKTHGCTLQFDPGLMTDKIDFHVE